MGGVFKDEFGNVGEQNLKETTNLLISNNNKVTRLLKRLMDWGLVKKVEHNAYIIINNQLDNH